MSLRVGLGASQADLDVQGEIDFEFFEESDATNKSIDFVNDNNSKLGSFSKTDPNSEALNSEITQKLEDQTKNVESAQEPDSSLNFNKPLITVSCEKNTGAIQKTTIEAVIPTPFNYKDSKCGKLSPAISRKSKALSPRLKNKIFDDDNEFSDDSSLSSMSPSESDLSSLSDESLDQGDGTDSMTDVSPLCSPYQCHTPVLNEQNDDANKTSQEETKLAKKEGVKFTDEVKVNHCAKCETVDLNELFKAVKRLEIEQNVSFKEKSSISSISRPSTQNMRHRKNMSFSNEEVRQIDHNNQNLLRKILAQQTRPKPRPNSAIPIVPSSAINRQRQQRQIELENIALLKRLEAAKPSRDLSRFHLLRDYERRSSGVSSRASSSSSQHCSTSSCRSSVHSSGRSSTMSLHSSASSGASSLTSVISKTKRSSLVTTAKT